MADPTRSAAARKGWETRIARISQHPNVKKRGRWMRLTNNGRSSPEQMSPEDRAIYEAYYWPGYRKHLDPLNRISDKVTMLDQPGGDLNRGRDRPQARRFPIAFGSALATHHSGLRCKLSFLHRRATT